MKVIFIVFAFLMVGCTQNTYNNINLKNPEQTYNKYNICNCVDSYNNCCGCDIQWTDPDLIDDF